MKTVVGLYDQPRDAEKAVGVLESSGFSPASVRVLHSVDALWQHLGCTPGKFLTTDFAIGAALGIALYSLFGMLVAVGEIGLGFESTTAVEALLVFALLGVFVGGFLGVIFGLGAIEQESRLYLDGIRHGGALVVVRTADEHAERAMALLRQTHAEGVQICWRTSDHPAHLGLPRPKDRLSRWSRWVARSLGLALIVLVVVFFVEGFTPGEMPNPLALSLTEDFLLLALLMTFAGIVVAWRWEAIGGLLIVSSMLLFESLNAIAGGSWRVGVVELLFVPVGLIFLWDWWRTASAEHGHSAAPSA